ncbi:hypothetical protein C0995_009248, partial [Termitomyces sp. Mi166
PDDGIRSDVDDELTWETMRFTLDEEFLEEVQDKGEEIELEEEDGYWDDQGLTERLVELAHAQGDDFSDEEWLPYELRKNSWKAQTNLNSFLVMLRKAEPRSSVNAKPSNLMAEDNSQAPSPEITIWQESVEVKILPETQSLSPETTIQQESIDIKIPLINYEDGWEEELEEELEESVGGGSKI